MVLIISFQHLPQLNDGFPLIFGYFALSEIKQHCGYFVSIKADILRFK